MTGQEMQAKLMAQLDQIFTERGRGVQTAVTLDLGVPRNYFVRVRHQDHQITWNRLGQILEILEVDPFEFFAEAFRPDLVTPDELAGILPSKKPLACPDHLDEMLDALRQRDVQLPDLERMSAALRRKRRDEIA